MNKIIVGILIVTLVLTTTFATSIKINNEDIVHPLTFETDVPVWEIGDSWTYIVNLEINNDVEKTSGSYYNDLEIEYEVVDDSGEYYTLEGTSTLNPGVMQFYIGTLNLVSSRFGNHVNVLKLRKSDLGIYSFDSIGEGILFISIGGLTLPIPIQFEGNGQNEIDPVWQLIPFPLIDGKSGDIPATTYINKGSYYKLLWGLIQIEFPESQWSNSAIPYTITEKQVTVEAGTFDVYEVDSGYNHYYFRPIYSEEVGNVVKYTHYIEHGDSGVIYHSMEMELKDYNYTP